MADEHADLQAKLEEAFAAATALYQARGFQRRIGFGRRPALINVDLANAWTRPGNPFTCEKMDDQIIPGVQRLLEACRQNGHAVVHTTTCYQVTDRDDPHTDMGLWHHKIPIEVVDEADTEVWAIDSRIAPVDGEQVLVKKRASAFHGTYLAGFLRAAGGRHDPGDRRDRVGVRTGDDLRRSCRRVSNHRGSRVHRRPDPRCRRMEPVRHRR